MPIVHVNSKVSSELGSPTATTLLYVLSMVSDNIIPEHNKTVSIKGAGVKCLF